MSKTERTLAIVKPDAVSRNWGAEVLGYFARAGLRPLAAKMVRLSKRQAQEFYYVHKDKGFYDSLCDFMSSGPCIAAVLSGENVIARTRSIMGATDPKQAEEGTIRRRFGTSVQENAVHGSDSAASAVFEIGFFFSELELMQNERE